ncbi:hypothetical protein LOD99_15204 [Oopsacas minuta]|uniref:Uncharacterized protein n=1 Tax=Oopsacas minuta TaxID=111878 RepID=A0AAV7KAA6_9METZ|nr:hypothetical protein LOD99_15204 [Oopsacas minuta]
MVLTDILSEFRSVTEKFQSYITGNSYEISRTLLTNQISTSTSASSKPARDHEILKLLDGDISGYNVQGLRRLVSAIIKVSTRKGIFWNDPSLKPPFWPERAPFENIKSACTTINAFCTLLKKNFPHLQELQDTILSENRQFVKVPRPSIQLHHDSAPHWVCSSIDVEGHVTLYDSLSTGRISGELAVQLTFLYGNDADHELKVALAPIQQQRGGRIVVYLQLQSV